MRTLKNWRKHNIVRTSIDEGKALNTPAECYYEKFSTISTKLGYVTAIEFNWETNYGRIYFTQFMAINDGMVITADIDEANLSDRNLKWMATHFIKIVNKKAAPKNCLKERPVELSNTNINNKINNQ